MRPTKTKSPLRVLLEAGHTLKDISDASGVSYQTVRDVSAGRARLSHVNAEKIAVGFPLVSIDFLMGTTDTPEVKPRDEYEDQSTAIAKPLAPTTPALFAEVAVKALEQAAKLAGYDLPSNPMQRHLIAHESVYGSYPTYTREALARMTAEQRTAAAALGRLSKSWKGLPDTTAPQHTAKTAGKKWRVGERMSLHTYLSYARSQFLPTVEKQPRTDLMTAFEALLLNAEDQLVREIKHPRGIVESRNDSYLVAHEVMAFIRATREKYKIRPDFSFLQKRLLGQEYNAPGRLTREIMTEPEPKTLKELYERSAKKS
jgi:hypothetical protein